MVLVLLCVLALVGCNNKSSTIKGSEVYSFPEPTTQITGSYCSQGTENTFVIGSEEYNPDDLSTHPIIEWFYGLELRECEIPETVEGNETYSFTVKDRVVFEYDYRGNTAFLIVNEKWYEVQNPTVPPLDETQMSPEKVIAE